MLNAQNKHSITQDFLHNITTPGFFYKDVNFWLGLQNS